MNDFKRGIIYGAALGCSALMILGGIAEALSGPCLCNSCINRRAGAVRRRIYEAWKLHQAAQQAAAETVEAPRESE